MYNEIFCHILLGLLPYKSAESALSVLIVLIPLTVLNFLKFMDSCVFMLELELCGWLGLYLFSSFFTTVFLQIRTRNITNP